MYVQVFRLRRKSHTLLDDPRISPVCLLSDVRKTTSCSLLGIAHISDKVEVFRVPLTFQTIFLHVVNICRGILN